MGSTTKIIRDLAACAIVGLCGLVFFGFAYINEKQHPRMLTLDQCVDRLVESHGEEARILVEDACLGLQEDGLVR